MVTVGIVAIVLLGLGFVIFPQFRIELALLIPFAPLIICLAMCPIAMYFGMRGSHDGRGKMKE